MSIPPKLTVFSRSTIGREATNATSKDAVASETRARKSNRTLRGHQQPLELPQVRRRSLVRSPQELIDAIATSSPYKRKRQRPSSQPVTNQFPSRQAQPDSPPPSKSTQPRRESRSGSYNSRQRPPAQMPQTQPVPAWLSWLMTLQRRSSIVTFLLASTALAVYGGTVYTEQLWNQEYRQLQSLQLQERQLITAGEILKNHAAKQAEQQNTGLVAPTPSTNLFLPAPTSGANSPGIPTAPASTTPNPLLTPTPLGY